MPHQDQCHPVLDINGSCDAPGSLLQGNAPTKAEYLQARRCSYRSCGCTHTPITTLPLLQSHKYSWMCGMLSGLALEEGFWIYKASVQHSSSVPNPPKKHLPSDHKYSLIHSSQPRKTKMQAGVHLQTCPAARCATPTRPRQTPKIQKAHSYLQQHFQSQHRTGF